jgi:hypothetical protein
VHTYIHIHIYIYIYIALTHKSVTKRVGCGVNHKHSIIPRGYTTGSVKYDKAFTNLYYNHIYTHEFRLQNKRRIYLHIFKAASNIVFLFLTTGTLKPKVLNRLMPQ